MSTLSDFDAVFITLMALLLVFATVSNVMVLIIVYRNKKMKNVTNIFICNLAVSDILLAAFVLPPNIHDISHEDHFHEGE